ncbi:MAG: hypothetical protein ACK55Z_37975, partial [bacterium]
MACFAAILISKFFLLAGIAGMWLYETFAHIAGFTTSADGYRKSALIGILLLILYIAIALIFFPQYLWNT